MFAAGLLPGSGLTYLCRTSHLRQGVGSVRFQFPVRFGAACLPFAAALLLGGMALSTWCHAETTEEENTTARMQLTYNWQRHPSYHADYSGPNSIIAGHEKMYTFTADAFLGFRPWQGGEIYLTPEV